MGLAASQARFLAITSRKARCEFQSMAIAQDKLSVTRDLAKISQDYQNALNQTSLAWDFDGSGENLFDLTYGLLMTPTALNNFNPCLITDRVNRVVLNGPMAKAAEAICPGGQPGERSQQGYLNFLFYLQQYGIITLSEKNALNGVANTNYDPKAGYGAEPMNKNGAIANNIYGLAHKVEEFLENQVGYTTKKEYDGDIFNLLKSENLKVFVDGAERTSGVTFSDILTKDVSIVLMGLDGEHEPDSSAFNFNLLAGNSYGVNDVYYAIVDAFESILNTDGLTGVRLEEVSEFITSTYNNGPANAYQYVAGSKTSQNTVVNELLNLAGEHNDMVFFKNKGDNYNSGIALNLSNMLGVYLTMFETKLNGYGNGYWAGSTMSSSSLVTDDQNYAFVMNDENAIDNVTLLKSDFYMQIYNNICINGWTQNPDVDSDPEYLEQMLKNGNYFITSLNHDGYFYQSRYNELESILEVKDTDAITQAEAEYTSQKAKLTYKEEQLDLDMKNLDAEISALTTEYDTVKNLISKNVEKVFQMFQ